MNTEMTVIRCPAFVARLATSSAPGPPISPYVYGQFLEHAGGLIYSSFWCELLDDRKFYCDVTNKFPENPNAGACGFGGFPGRRNVGPGRWNPVGPMDSVVMDMMFLILHNVPLPVLMGIQK